MRMRGIYCGVSYFRRFLCAGFSISGRICPIGYEGRGHSTPIRTECKPTNRTLVRWTSICASSNPLRTRQRAAPIIPPIMVPGWASTVPLFDLASLLFRYGNFYEVMRTRLECCVRQAMRCKTNIANYGSFSILVALAWRSYVWFWA